MSAAEVSQRLARAAACRRAMIASAASAIIGGSPATSVRRSASLISSTHTSASATAAEVSINSRERSALRIPILASSPIWLTADLLGMALRPPPAAVRVHRTEPTRRNVVVSISAALDGLQRPWTNKIVRSRTADGLRWPPKPEVRLHAMQEVGSAILLASNGQLGPAGRRRMPSVVVATDEPDDLATTRLVHCDGAPLTALPWPSSAYN